ncbi:hypothetical protein PVL29_024625 [Vitis rotundifolia]|uniref:ADP-ribosyl cyclase/cyclic ADP-ribose hydrolase n=1 Tax=Vitis rotundifolia TaxID=103349 RepID=A0AA38YSL1_VITRO|nr:hypothetical protein PVL29_024625 [Vitis rotundifolia]
MAFANPQSQRASSSSSSISIPGWNYVVFLSFMGEDTRHNCTDHLYRALNRKGIPTFRDDEELPRGEEISRICLIILSENYARSRWCLEELTKIMDCRGANGKISFADFLPRGTIACARTDSEFWTDSEQMGKLFPLPFIIIIFFKKNPLTIDFNVFKIDFFFF